MATPTPAGGNPLKDHLDGWLEKFRATHPNKFSILLVTILIGFGFFLGFKLKELIADTRAKDNESANIAAYLSGQVFTVPTSDIASIGSKDTTLAGTSLELPVVKNGIINFESGAPAVPSTLTNRTYVLAVKSAGKRRALKPEMNFLRMKFDKELAITGLGDLEKFAHDSHDTFPGTIQPDVYVFPTTWEPGQAYLIPLFSVSDGKILPGSIAWLPTRFSLTDEVDGKLEKIISNIPNTELVIPKLAPIILGPGVGFDSDKDPFQYFEIIDAIKKESSDLPPVKPSTPDPVSSSPITESEANPPASTEPIPVVDSRPGAGDPANVVPPPAAPPAVGAPAVSPSGETQQLGPVMHTRSSGVQDPNDSPKSLDLNF